MQQQQQPTFHDVQFKEVNKQAIFWNSFNNSVIAHFPQCVSERIMKSVEN